MKKFILLLLLLFFVISIKAQDYLIGFAGTGASETVDSVNVENLTRKVNMKLGGSEMLHLLTTGINRMTDFEKALRIYPNPATDNIVIEFVALVPGLANIELFDITGKKIASTQNSLTVGIHSYKVSGIKCGIYTVRIYSQTYILTGKVVANGTLDSGATISYVGNSTNQVTSKNLKSGSVEKTMEYITGDLLKFTAVSGNYSTVATDIPTQSKTITFSFVQCTDVGQRNYPVLQIGDQIWMAENLAYLPSVSPPSQKSSTAPYYYVYGYNGTDIATAKTTQNYKDYGVLYNWPAAIAACPPGWHLPSDNEWTALETFLGGKWEDGGKLKETGTTHWISPNGGATNEFGFSALPGGGLGSDGIFDSIGLAGIWWSSTATSSSFAYIRYLNYINSNIDRLDLDKDSGFSVRCVKNK